MATRSAGQASTGYGRIDELVEAVRCETPAGALATRDVPATAAGPSLRELIVGSEGMLGVITEATLRVRPLPEARHYEGWSFRTFEEGAEALRAARAGRRARRTWPGSPTRTRRGCRWRCLPAAAWPSARARRTCALRGHEGGCLAFTGFEGTPDDVARRRGRAAETAARGRGRVARAAPGTVVAARAASPLPTCATSCSTAA